MAISLGITSPCTIYWLRVDTIHEYFFSEISFGKSPVRSTDSEWEIVGMSSFKVHRSFQMTSSAVNGEEFTPEVVDAESHRMIQAGARPVIPPRDEPYGMRISFVADPEGNQIEICCSLDDIN